MKTSAVPDRMILPESKLPDPEDCLRQVMDLLEQEKTHAALSAVHSYFDVKAEIRFQKAVNETAQQLTRNPFMSVK